MVKHVVLMRFSAVMQSWGAYSLQTSNSTSPRNTESFPTKSSLIGIIRCALGIRRTPETLNLTGIEKDLVASKMWIREDSRGILGKDYQVARSHHGFTPSFQKEIPKNFLQDAVFLVLLEVNSEEVANRIVNALNHPVWGTYIGRRAHVPTLPECIGYYQTNDILEDLKNLPALKNKSYRDNDENDSLRIVILEKNNQDGYSISFQDEFNGSFHPLYANNVDRIAYIDSVNVTNFVDIKDRSPLLAQTEELIKFVYERNHHE